MLKRMFVLALVSLLTACAGTGGTIGGLFPAPKFLDGKVEGDTYYSPTGAFSVKLPHPPTDDDERYEWSYTKVLEINDGPIEGVVFGPAAMDENLYHAVLIKSPPKQPIEEYVDSLFQRKAADRQSKLEQKLKTEFQLNGKRCFYAVYASENYYLVLSLTDNGNSFYVVEADVPVTPFTKAKGVNLMRFTEREWVRFNRMLESFSVIGEG